METTLPDTMSKQAGIKVFAPATVGNLAVGFDILGLALEKPGDELIARFSDKPGIQITAITGAKGKLPKDPLRNTAGYAALQLLKHLGEEKLGFEFELHKKMPIGSGLGSSAASAVAGVMAVNELLKRPLEKKELLPFAMQGEFLASGGMHADNVAPSLLGGILLCSSGQQPDIQRLPSPRGLYVAVLYPHVEVLTKAARKMLSDAVPLKKHIQQSANLGGFIIGMYNSNFELIARSLKDVIIEPQRQSLIPEFSSAQQAALNEGALGCSISGAGPSIFALCQNSLIAENVGMAMQRIYHDAKIESNLYISAINHEGAVKL